MGAFSLRGRRTKGREGEVECEREARSAMIALRALVVLRARIQLPPPSPLYDGHAG